MTTQNKMTCYSYFGPAVKSVKPESKSDLRILQTRGEDTTWRAADISFR